MPKGKLVRFGVYLTRERRKQLLLTAIEEDISATKLVERLIAAYLDQGARGQIRCSRAGLEAAHAMPQPQSHDE